MKLRIFVFLLKFFFASIIVAFGQPPKLIVSIVIDQFRYDFLPRFNHLFVPNGFRRLTEGGAFMTYAHLNYFPTWTAPGHSSYLSCTVPALHGIIGNDWYDRKTGKPVYCVSDPTVNTVGSNTEHGKMSPRNYIGSTFADELRMSNNFQSKVISVSIKDRSAILPAGKHPTGAFWLDGSTGAFITSSYYMNALPKWASDFNMKKQAESSLNKKWDKLLPEENYKISDTDEGHGEGSLPGETSSTFPHLVADLKNENDQKRFDAFVCTPFANQLIIDFAVAAVVGERLGRRNFPDLLLISFSANDLLGHRFGPYSQEVQDITLRLDRQLEKFLSFLDKQIGLKDVLIVLTADHGVAPNPEYSKLMGLDAKRYDPTGFAREIENKLREQFGPGKYISSFINEQFYINHNLLKEKNLSVAEVGHFIGHTATSIGEMKFYFTRESLLKGEAPGVIGHLVLNGFNGERSGDVIIVRRPFDIFYYEKKTGTTHGSPYSYDTHVPIIFYGSAIRPGRYSDQVNITDIVPTLTTILSIQEPSGCIGRPIKNILR